MKNADIFDNQNIARVQNCPDITISNSLFGLLSFCLFIFLSFCLYVFFFVFFCPFFCIFVWTYIIKTLNSKVAVSESVTIKGRYRATRAGEKQALDSDHIFWDVFRRSLNFEYNSNFYSLQLLCDMWGRRGLISNMWARCGLSQTFFRKCSGICRQELWPVERRTHGNSHGSGGRINPLTPSLSPSPPFLLPL